MRKLFLLLTAVSSFIFLAAQKKNFTYDQAFKGAVTNLSKPMPAVVKWLDNIHFIETIKEAQDKTSSYSIDVKTGKAVPYIIPANKVNTPLPVIKDAKNITASPDGKWMAYTKKDNNIYTTEISTNKELQLTSDGSETILNGYASWVYYEEILGRASHYRAFWWSPDSKCISFMRFDDAQVPVFPIFWADGQHGYIENERYPKAGDKNPEVKIGIISLDNNKTVWADFNTKDDQYFGTPYWTINGQFWVNWMNRGQDNVKLYNINLNNGSKNEIIDEKQNTWVNFANPAFLESGMGFIMASDKTGWRQYYKYDMNGKLVNQITEGDFTAGEIFKIDEKANLLFFSARKENSARFDLYSASLDGKKISRLSSGDYSYSGMNISPDLKYYITTYSNTSMPPTMVVMDMNGKVLRELGNAKGAEFDNYNLPKKELVRVKSTDGLFDLPVLITYPINFDANKKYPVLVNIYGGPNAGTVYDSWKFTPADGWWAQEGLVQVSFDNRSSGHFGKKGMNYIHRQLGKYEMEDYMACGRWIKQQPWADNKKLCITGGSFGGYMTCMALTYGSDVFDFGIANSSVTDWQLYDSHYTERFMDTPQENPEGYKQTAVLTYINQYKGLIRIVHGSADDNVHMQNSLQVINKLEDLKKHFEFMIYPGERHGIAAAKGVHNRTEAYTFYYKYLLGKEMPAEFWK